MQFSEVVTGEHFRNLAALLRVAFRLRWQKRHVRVPVKLRVNEISRALFIDGQMDKAQVIAAYSKLLSEVTAADKYLGYTTADMEWLVAALESKDGKAIGGLLLAYAQAPKKPRDEDASETPA